MTPTTTTTIAALGALALAAAGAPAAARAQQAVVTYANAPLYSYATAVDPNTVDSDGDGYTDYEETHNPLFTNPQADYHPAGVYRADPHVFDIFVEVDFMTKKTAQVPYFWTPWHGWYYTTVTVEGAHELKSSTANDMIARFREHNMNLFFVISDEIAHEDNVGYDRWDALLAQHRDFAPYYHVLLAHKHQGQMAGDFGVSIRDHVIIFDGEIAIKLMQQPDVMHELGHCLIDSAYTNPKAHHLLDKPDVWNDGIHCPYNCTMNYASKLGIGGLFSQFWETNYDWRCWGAVRGRYQF